MSGVLSFTTYMPILPDSAYRAPKWFSNNHVQTIYHALVRQVKGVDYLRERVELPDGDFLDLDIATVGAQTGVYFNAWIRRKFLFFLYARYGPKRLIAEVGMLSP